MARASTVLSFALAELGYSERAGGWTKFGAWYGDLAHDSYFDDAAWCAMFASWCLDQAGQHDVGTFASTPAWAKWLKAHGQWGTTPKPGALVFFDWDGSRDLDRIDHVALVIEKLADGRIHTVEGNTANMVAERYRSTGAIVGYGYPGYSPAAPIKPVPPPLLVLGARGKVVKTAQELLQDHGYKLEADGVFGPITQTRVRAFQRAKKLEIDGKVGKHTWAELKKPAPKKK